MIKLATKLTAIAAIATLTGIVSGCNTVKGVGQDMEAGGQKLQQTAHKQQVKPNTPTRARTTTTTTTYRKSSY